MNSDYSYELPPNAIAQAPHKPRDMCKLLVYNTREDSLTITKFFYLPKFLPEHSALILNDSRVMKARITLSKENGNQTDMLFFAHELFKDGYVEALSPKKLLIGSRLFFLGKEVAQVVDKKDTIYYLNVFNKQKFLSILNTYGKVPLPPYLKATTLGKKQLKDAYQTVFAHKSGSYAAPTASLHFTKRLLNKIEQECFKNFFVTLHVGYGTFAPLTPEALEQGKLHSEAYEIPQNTLQFLKTNNKKSMVVAGGTTVVRTLESWAQEGVASGTTEMFIRPGYKFKVVDGLITNFHVPNSSLLMLVDAFLQFKKSKKTIKELYAYALKNNFKFLSFGDAMLII